MDEHRRFIVMTDDGSSTALLGEYGEQMHSRSGAYEEALHKHLFPSRVLERSEHYLSVLDVGFGLGYNILALAMEFQRRNSPGNLSIISLEQDRSFTPLLESIAFNDERDDAYRHICRAYQLGHADLGTISITVMFGDARNTIRQLVDGSFHAIFFDPFSPARNPELWTMNFFMEMYRVMKNGAILTTYSSASHVRAAMIEAGLTVGRGPSVGGKREGTLASKGCAIRSLSPSEIAAIRSDQKSVPFRDSSLTDSRETIREMRRREIRLRKKSPDA